MAGVALLSALMFRRLFEDWSFLPEVVGAALLPLVIGGVGRRLRLPSSLSFLVSVVVGWLYIAWTLFPDTTAYGVPWKGSVKEASRLVHVAWQKVPTEVAPITVDTGFVLLAAVGVWFLAVAADTLAVSWELPLLGLLPWISLVAVIGAVGEPAGRAGWALAFLGAAFVYLGVCAAEEKALRTRPLRVEGRRVSPPFRGVGIAGGTLLLALIVAPAVPGFGEAPLVRYRGGIGGGDRIGLSPLVDIKFRLQQNPPVPVFTVQATGPAYWRVLALDDFNGQIWGASGRYRPAGSVLPAAPGSSPTRPLRQTYEIQGLAQFWLPAAYAPRSIQATDVRIDANTLTLATDHETAQGLAYAVQSDVPVPGSTALENAGGPDPAEAQANLALPPDFPAAITGEAHRLADGATTRYGKVRAIQDYLRSFEYSEEPPPGHDVLSMERFLFELRRGYCEQFSSTMAAMLRSIGVPARVAVGFTPGRFDAAGGVYQVTTHEAHAWVEAYFPGYGWLQFDPTPTRNDPNEANYNGTRPSSPTVSTTTPSTIGSLTGGIGASATTEPSTTEDTSQAAIPSTRRGGIPRAFFYVLVAVAVPLLAGGGIAGAKAWRRRARLNAPVGRRAQALWHEVVDLLTDAGLVVAPSETAVETSRRAAVRFPDARAPMEALAQAQYAELFAPDEEEPAADPAACEADIRGVVLGSFERMARLRVVLNLASLRRRRRPLATAAVPTGAYALPAR